MLFPCKSIVSEWLLPVLKNKNEESAQYISQSRIFSVPGDEGWLGS